MSSFADFALLASIPSYGGAEILRAQRILPSGAGPRVHLALFGRSDVVARRVVDVAAAAANVEHPALARILEVGRYDGIVYGVAEAAEGVDVASLLISDRARKRTPPAELALGIATAVARLVVALHESGDTWAPQDQAVGAAVGLASVFPAGLGPETLFLEPGTPAGQAVRLRVIAAAAGDPRAPSPFRAPDQRPSQAGDVYAVGRLLMALLAGDPTGQETPRLSSASPLTRLLPRLLDARADERPDLHDVVERLEQALTALGTTPEQAVQQALAGPYRNLVVDAASGFVPAPRIVDDIRANLPDIHAGVQRLFPTVGRATTLPTPFAALPAATSDEGAAVFTDARPATPAARRGKTVSTVIIDDLQALAMAPVPLDGPPAARVSRSAQRAARAGAGDVADPDHPERRAPEERAAAGRAAARDLERGGRLCRAPRSHRR